MVLVPYFSAYQGYLVSTYVPSLFSHFQRIDFLFYKCCVAKSICIKNFFYLRITL